VKDILQALAVTAELCGSDLSEAAGKVIVADLAAYPPEAVLLALTRVRREHKGRLTLAAILERLPEDRPGPEEAWASIPKDEYTTAVLTVEANLAAGPAMAIYLDGDKVGARMAFREGYLKLVADAKARGIPAEWVVSPGWDGAGRIEPIAEAVKLGRITTDVAMHHMSDDMARGRLTELVYGGSSGEAIAGPKSAEAVPIGKLLRKMGRNLPTLGDDL